MVTDNYLAELAAKMQADWAAGAYDREIESIRLQRLQAYEMTADPLFFKWQAGEGTEQEWKDARAAVVEAYPYPEPPAK